jgi:hypothetical protein
MARVLVLTDEQDRILFHERVDPIHLEDEHYSLQILERLAGAVQEASQPESERRVLYA